LVEVSRTLDNLRAAISKLPHVLIFDNSDLDAPFRQVAVFHHGQPTQTPEAVPEWLQSLLD
ncbi:MAG TPA: hypothetical protein VGX76_19915, partial [Pirellulales bacterium]|jgi:hypothetical protein|nr:hypothetical protein [Pirellulales bacterium]